MTDQKAIQRYQQFKTALTNDDVKARFEQILRERSDVFLASLLSVVANSKGLQNCDTNSILTAAAKAAILDLPIEPELGQAYIVPFKNTATFIAGYKGLLQLALRTNQYKAINVAPIYQGEQVIEDRITGDIKINGKQSGPEIIGWAGYFETKGGFKKFLYMSKEDIHAHAERYSPSYKVNNGAWTTNTTDMEKKTVLRQLLSKWGLMSIQMQDADSAPIYQTETGEDLVVPDFGDVIEGRAEDVPEEQPEQITAGQGEGDSPTGWDKPYVDAILNSGAAQHPKHAVMILNKLQPQSAKQAGEMGDLYRKWREGGAKVEEAAELTIAGERP